MLDPAQLPAIWLAALDLIAGNRAGLETGVACLPGGDRTADGLIAAGIVERFPQRPQVVTLTPWGAEWLGVEPYEWSDDGEPVWVLSARVVEDESIGARPFVSRGLPKHVLRDMDLRAERCREWYVEDDEPKTLTTRARKKAARAERVAAAFGRAG